MILTHLQVRAARALLDIHQDTLAKMAGISVATVRRYETGHVISKLALESLMRALIDGGIVLIPEGARIGGQTVRFGVALTAPKR